MKQTKTCFVSGTSLVLFLFLLSPARGQIDVGDYTISGGGESAVCRGTLKGTRPGLKSIGIYPKRHCTSTATDDRGKKEDFYFNADSYKTGLNDQSYTLRVGRYGLLDMEFQWDQIPHWFSNDHARTPYTVNEGYDVFTSFLQAHCNHGHD